MRQHVPLSYSNVGLHPLGVPPLCRLEFGDALSRAVKVTSQRQQMVDFENEFARDLRQAVSDGEARRRRGKSYPTAGLVLASASPTLLEVFVATAMGRIV